ncbi:IS5 family transposase [Neisseria dentiae]|uniref:IS5 family transposase n=2 Tax=Neisseria dentiae TaxID=194197 RepID=UPI000E1BBC3D|nr:IS5 family transposase [Neisseria dentiae]QMT45935.1 IS5 family transposase [Neisseria dentiae]
MTRYILTDAQWAKIEPLCQGKVGDAGRTAVDNRLFIEAILWIIRTGSPWRDLPEEFGNWKSIHKRYRRWVLADRFHDIFEELNRDLDMEYVMIDGTIVKVHRHGQGAKGGLLNQAIGQSKGGMTTKILAMVDALGNLIDFKLMPGQRNDICGVEPLIKEKEFDALLADKAFDADWLVEELTERGSKVVIPLRNNRKLQREHDKMMYCWRHLIENFFCKLKEFKKIAMRAEKTDQSFAANIYLAAAVLKLR